MDIVVREDGTFQFHHRVPCEGGVALTDSFQSGSYISAETAEAAARLKFKL